MLEKLLNSKKYDFLITTNNAMQDIVDSVSSNYPHTKFLIFDSLVKTPTIKFIQFLITLQKRHIF